MTPRLVTARLVIRPFEPDDLPAVAEIVTDPQVFWWLSQPLDEAGAKAWLNHEMHELDATGSGTYAIWLADPGVVIGGVALKRRELDGSVEYELGYHLGRRWWGRGYATEAGRAMLAEARVRGLTRVAAFIHPHNRRSQQVAERLGMTRERRIEWAGLPHDLWSIEFDQSGVETTGVKPGDAPCYHRTHSRPYPGP